ncbi:MAG: HDOD domain-containing protein [Planctomycetes bacterium]|nr:HDOD domain-containing protein [Planctomycetota bacterium]
MPVGHRRSLGATRVMPTAIQPDVPSRLRLHQQIELMLAPLDALPSLPAVVVRLIEVTGSDATHLDALVELVESNSHLSAAVAALARELGVHAGRGDVGVRESIRLLGSHRARNAILSAYLYHVLMSLDVTSASTLNREAYWKHSVAVACAAELLADALGGPSAPADVFVCGLLHDIGKPALAATLPKSYARVLDAVRQQGACLLDAERATLGFDHTVAGKRLAVLWKLPRRVVESIWLHHQLPDDLPESLESPLTVQIVHLADRLARQEGIGWSGCAQAVSVDGPADWLGIEPAVLEGIRRILPSQIEQALRWITTVDPQVAAISSPATSMTRSELIRPTASLVEDRPPGRPHSSGLQVLQRLSGRLGDSDTVAEVCLEVARSVRAELQVGGAIAFCFNRSGTLCYSGFCGPDGHDTRVQTITGRPIHGRPSRVRWSAPSRFAEPVLRCWGSRRVGGALLSLPVIHAGRLIGGVLVAATVDEAAELQVGDQSAWEAAATAFGLAMSRAVAGSEADKLHEELAEANRRLHAVQARLVRDRSLGMVAKMADGAAHELNNPLAVISGRAQMLLMDPTIPPGRRKALEAIHTHSNKCSQIVNDLMDFAKPPPPQASVVLLADVVQSLRSAFLADTSLQPDQLTVELHDVSATVYADVAQVNDALQAILVNALEAMEPGKAPRITINSRTGGSDDTVVLAIEDNGCGMSAEVLAHALDPFFSHRSAGRGRGLGLSRAYRLIEANGGVLSLESRAGQGTRVEVRLPAGP